MAALALLHALAAAAADVRLDLRPLRDPWSLEVTVASGTAQAIRYSPHRLQVAAVFAAPLGPAEAPGVEQLALALLSGPPPAGVGGEEPGPREGDLFVLRVESRGAGRELRGLVENAPAVARELIERLRVLAGRLPRVPDDSAYLRGEAVSPDRLAAIRRRGRVPVLDLSAFAPAAVAPLRAARSRAPFLLPVRGEALAALSIHGRELVVVEAEAALQVTLLAAATDASEEKPLPRR